MTDIDPSRYQSEYEIEMNSIDVGIARYNQLRQESDPSVMNPEQRYICQGMLALIPAIEDAQRSAANGVALKGVRKWGLPLLSLPADKLALITLVTIFNEGDHQTYTKTALSIASACKTERLFALIKKTAPDVYKKINHRVKQWERHAVYRAKKMCNSVDVDWDLATRTWLGAKLLELALTSCDMFEYQSRREYGQLGTKLTITDEVRQDLEKQHESSGLLKPYWLPMVVPPNPWAWEKQGGYLYHRTRFVKTEYIDDAEYATRYKSIDPLVYDSINRLQSTPWRINRTVLSVAGALWDAGGNLAGLPPRYLIPVPPRAEGIEQDPEALVAWKRSAAAVHDENADLVSARKSVLMKLKIADSFKEFDRIWFPWQVDWRGRAYPMPSELHPQADDLGRGLIEFASGKPLGEHGYYWLTIHVANCLGLGGSFEDRYEAVQKKYSTRLTQWAADPLTHRGWMDDHSGKGKKQGDDPFKLLAAAREWAQASALMHPSTYVSYIPVSVDGTCNGLQHFSALGRDPVGGAATNLVPDDHPHDVYQEVADVVVATIESDCETVPKLADQEHPPPWECWRGQVSRNTVKRATMTTCYNVTKQGIRTQFKSDGHVAELVGEINANLNYMRDTTINAIGTVVVSAREMMDWLIECARIASEHGIPIVWESPVGFPVHQEYLEQKVRTVHTTLQKINLREPHPSRIISGTKQERGLPPNYIHSLDAAHMMCTVLACADAGIIDTSMVHDSYATHACDIPALNRILREQFVEMHSFPLLLQFKQRLELALPDDTDLPEIPKLGSLDLEDVKRSPYFFH